MSTSDLRGRFDDDTAQDRLILTTLVDADALLMQALPSAIDDLRGAGRLFSRTAADDLVFGSPRFAQFLDGLKPEFDSSVSAWACSSTSLQGFCAVREYPPCA